MKAKALYISLVMIVCLMGTGAYAQSAESWYERGVAAEYSKNYDSARRAYSEAIRLNPSLAQAYLKRGALTFSLSPSLSVEALGDLNRAIELDPDNGEAFYQRARVSFFMLNNEAGRRDMIKAAGLGHEGAKAYLRSPSVAAFSAYIDLGSHISPERPSIVFFDFDSTRIDEQARQLLDAIASLLLRDQPDIRVYIAGHTDNRGSEEYNQVLSMRRAQTVLSYLAERGVTPADRLVMRYYGETRPLASNDSNEGRAKNRRVELIGIKR